MFYNKVFSAGFILAVGFSSGGFAAGHTQACVKSFSAPASFSQMQAAVREKLQALSPHKPRALKNTGFEDCGSACLRMTLDQSFYGELSKHGTLKTTGANTLRFQLAVDHSIPEPQLLLQGDLKLLKVPSIEYLRDNQKADYYIKSWLVGHPLHPLSEPFETQARLSLTQTQNKALTHFKQALSEGQKSFLHIAPTSSGKNLVLAEALKHRLLQGGGTTKKLSLVTAHQIHLVKQIFEVLKKQFEGLPAHIIHFHSENKKSFFEEVKTSSSNPIPLVAVITTQSLKRFLQRATTSQINFLTENLEGFYIDEAHHLGATLTHRMVHSLKQKTNFVLYGATATPLHHKVPILPLFEAHHWSYLPLSSAEKSISDILHQLSEGIQRGEITPFDDMYVIGDNAFQTPLHNKELKQQEVFIKGETQFYVLNPRFYKRLTEILFPIIEANKKGFIVAASIEEAEGLALFFNKVYNSNNTKKITFEAYHSKMSVEERNAVFKKSEESKKPHYIIAVRSLDEGVNLPHLSAYVDLNTNVSVKQMVHRIGRVLRIYPGKGGADILLFSDYKNASTVKDLLELLEAVETSSVSDYFHRGGIQNRGNKGTTPHHPVATGDSVIHPVDRKKLLKLRESLNAYVKKFWNTKENPRWPPKEKLVQLLKEKGINSTHYQDLRKKDPDLHPFPSNPKTAYKDRDFWYKVTGRKAPPRNRPNRSFPPKEELIQMLMEKGINSVSYQTFRNQPYPDPSLAFPSNPISTYKDPDFWHRIAGRKTRKHFPPKEELTQLLKEKGINSTRYQTFRKQEYPDPSFVFPANPISTYKDPYFWYTITGNTPNQYRTWPPAEEAIKTFQAKGVNSGNLKHKRKTDPELKNFPAAPLRTYKDPDFWYKVTGKRSTSSHLSLFPPVDEAIKILQTLRVLSAHAYGQQRKNHPLLKTLPYVPEISYKDPGFWKKVSELTL